MMPPVPENVENAANLDPVMPENGGLVWVCAEPSNWVRVCPPTPMIYWFGQYKDTLQSLSTFVINVKSEFKRTHSLALFHKYSE